MIYVAVIHTLKGYGFRYFNIHPDFSGCDPAWYYLNVIDLVSELLFIIPADKWLGDLTDKRSIMERIVQEKKLEEGEGYV